MRQASGYKIDGFNTKWTGRGLVNFDRPVEFGINVPMLDSKFLTSYEILTSAGMDPYHAAMVVNETVGNELSVGNVTDFDGDLIANCVIGPITKDGYKENYDVRPTRWLSPTSIATDFDINGDVNSISVGVGEGDTVIVARQPQTIVTALSLSSVVDNSDVEEQTATNFTIRKPKILNVNEHTNTLIGNFYSAQPDRFIYFPTTAQGSINPLLTYRFSFYYRIQGEMKAIPIIQYYTNTGSFLYSKPRSSMTLVGTASEDSDFDYVDLQIPDLFDGERLLPEVRRIRVVLKLQPQTDSIFEMAYPILEHSFDQSIGGVTFAPTSPSSIGYEDVHSAKLNTTPIGTNKSLDTTKLFNTHIGRKLFKVKLGWSLQDANIVDQLRVLENLNERGADIVMRPMHHDLPPVMIGNYTMSNTMPTPDYHINDVALAFEETT